MMPDSDAYDKILYVSKDRLDEVAKKLKGGENAEAKKTFDNLVKEGQADQLKKEAQLKKLVREKGSAKALKKIETGKFAKDNADMFKQGTDLAKKIQSGKM